MPGNIAYNPDFQCADCGTPWAEHGTACDVVRFNQRELPLVCRREGEQLVIRVGIDTLAFATEHCERFYVEESHASSGPPYVKVIDKGELMTDTIRELEREQEDGTSPLHILFDDAAEAAREDGSVAFADEEE